MNDRASDYDKQATETQWKIGQLERDPTLSLDPERLKAATDELRAQLGQIAIAKASMMRDYHAALAGYGDQDFQGVPAPPQFPGGGGRGVDNTQGTLTPNNPNDPSIPNLNAAPNPADNAPAVEPGSAPRGGAGMPPITGTMRPPTESRVGPLIRAPTAIPSLMPGVGGGPPDNSAAPPATPVPAGATSSLIPGI